MTKRRSIVVVGVLTLCMFFTGMVIILIAALLVDISKDLDTPVAVVGQLVTISAILSGTLSPIIGPLSDRLGRKRMVILGLAIIGISFMGYGISQEFSTLIMFTVLQGVGLSISYPNVLACIGDYFPAERQGKAMAVINLGPPLTAVAGVPLAAILTENLGWHTTFLYLGISMLVTTFLVVISLPTLHPARSAQSISYLSKLREVVQQKNVLLILAANVLMVSTYQVIEVYLVAFLMVSYSLNIGQVAPLISLMSIAQFVGTLAGGQIADRFSKIKTCTVTIILCGISGLFLFLYPEYIWLSLVLGSFFRGIYSINRPVYFTLMISISPKARGTIMGFSTTSVQIGRSLGAMLGGLMVGYFSYRYIGVLSFSFSIIALSVLTYINRASHLFESTKED
jgi:predicted MFS family arabinose efflux permease